MIIHCFEVQRIYSYIKISQADKSSFSFCWEEMTNMFLNRARKILYRRSALTCFVLFQGFNLRLIFLLQDIRLACSIHKETEKPSVGTITLILSVNRCQRNMKGAHQADTKDNGLEILLGCTGIVQKKRMGLHLLRSLSSLYIFLCSLLY